MKRYIGDMDFYRKTMVIALPIMLQNGITNFVNMLDNVMVGQVGTDPMSGVAIVNQLVFIFSLVTFGAMAGVGIFGAQYYGKEDMDGFRNTFRIKIIVGVLMGLLSFSVMMFCGDWFIRLYMKGKSEYGNAAATLAYGKQYLQIMMWGMIPFALVQTFSSTLRETSETVHPMIASMVAVVVNLAGNYILIYGKFGAPCLGVRGAAIATVTARFVELGYLFILTYVRRSKYIWIRGVFRSFRIPRELLLKVIRKGIPLTLNEALWSTGVTLMNQNFAFRGLHVVAALNIGDTMWNVLNVIYMALGQTAAIMEGQLLGASRMDEARERSYQFLGLSILIGLVVGGVMVVFSGIFPQFYNTEEDVRRLASIFILIFAGCSPVCAYLNAAYFIIRSGGRTGITFLFDSCYIWAFIVPVSYLLSYHTDLSIVMVMILVQACDLIKVTVGTIMIEKGIWVKNIVS